MRLINSKIIEMSHNVGSTEKKRKNVKYLRLVPRAPGIRFIQIYYKILLKDNP